MQPIDAIQKLLVFPVIVAFAILIAGLFGAAHNQISYTVSPEYFTEYKFPQFDLSIPTLPERLRASIVGVLGAWWMGIPIGFCIGLAGFMHRNASRMLQISVRSVLWAAGFTLLFALLGLLYGALRTQSIALPNNPGRVIPEGVTDVRRFLCAGTMHNAAYIGGLLSIAVAWAIHFKGRSD